MNEVLTFWQRQRGRGLLGAFFFGGLWWTVRRAISSDQPALWFFGSLLLRMGITLVGFYFVGQEHWERWLLPARFCPGRLVAGCLRAYRKKAKRDRRRRPAMRLSPDQIILWQYGFLKLNGTIAFTWGLMALLAFGSMLVTRKLSMDLKRSRWQNLLEIIVTGIEKQIADVGLRHPEKYIGFLGTLFLFIALASLCTIIPGYEPHRLALDHCGTRAVRTGGGAILRYRGAGPGGLPQILRGANNHHATVQHYQ